MVDDGTPQGHQQPDRAVTITPEERADLARNIAERAQTVATDLRVPPWIRATLKGGEANSEAQSNGPDNAMPAPASSPDLGRARCPMCGNPMAFYKTESQPEVSSPGRAPREIAEEIVREATRLAVPDGDCLILGHDRSSLTNAIEQDACNHAGWSFSKDGRCCRKCGAFVLDFGD